MNLLLGGCLVHLKTLPPDSVDSLVTDPPAGISFMGKDWDGDKGGRDHWIAWMTEVMKECLRVLKPGAHGLVWALPRTSHWTATALENAGFEVRDIITHLFGSGFPKSLDVSKAIDKAAGAEREVIKRDWSAYRVNAVKNNNQNSIHAGFKPEGSGLITAPSTDAAKQWQGFGTALKPANEHWILIRKPCSEKTVAANVLKWGCGALNIDASRIESIRPAAKYSQPVMNGGQFNAEREKRRIAETPENQGRFPANLVLSHSEHCEDGQCDFECAVKMLDAQSVAGGMHSAGAKRSGGKSDQSGAGAMFGVGNHDGNGVRIGDSGGASRFFYVAKISTKERGAGNNHPTVKPQKLMQYLIRMVTPPGGTVLDPFMGSGSTGMAARALGFEFTGIEMNPEYFDIARKRIG